MDDDIEALREIEVDWLSEQLSRAIANLGYPVGMGIPPHPEHIKNAAEMLFGRYAKMIGMARTEALASLTRDDIERPHPDGLS